MQGRSQDFFRGTHNQCCNTPATSSPYPQVQISFFRLFRYARTPGSYAPGVPLVVTYKLFNISLEPCPHGYYCPFNGNRAIPCPPGTHVNNSVPRGELEDCLSPSSSSSSRHQGNW